MDWNPATNKGVNELLALGFSDGSFRFITKAGKIDKEVKNAHKDAAVSRIDISAYFTTSLFNFFSLTAHHFKVEQRWKRTSHRR